MTDSILRRVQRVVSAGVGDALDAAERFSGPGLTREAIRRVEAEIAGMRRRQAAAEAGRSEAADQQRAYHKEAAGLTDDARFALDKGRPDLAERAIVRQLELEDSARSAAVSEASHAEEEERLASEITVLEARRAVLIAELNQAVARADGKVTAVPDIEAMRRADDVARRLAALRESPPAEIERAANRT